MSDTPESFQGYGRRCMLIFAVVMCITAMMWGVSASHLATSVSIILIMGAAVVNAALVASYLMHILSEKRMIFTVLLFTGIFFAMLFVLTIGARVSVPLGTAH